MDVNNDDAKGGFRRIEVLTGPARRRRWSVAEKSRIVAETLQAGRTVTEVARRWQVCPQQVWGWRREAREGHLALPESAAATGTVPDFVRLVTEAAPAITDAGTAETAARRSAKMALSPGIEVRLAGAVVRVTTDADAALLTAVLRAVRASAT